MCISWILSTRKDRQAETRGGGIDSEIHKHEVREHLSGMWRRR